MSVEKFTIKYLYEIHRYRFYFLLLTFFSNKFSTPIRLVFPHIISVFSILLIPLTSFIPLLTTSNHPLFTFSFRVHFFDNFYYHAHLFLEHAQIYAIYSVTYRCPTHWCHFNTDFCILIPQSLHFIARSHL